MLSSLMMHHCSLSLSFICPSRINLFVAVRDKLSRMKSPAHFNTNHAFTGRSVAVCWHSVCVSTKVQSTVKAGRKLEDSELEIQ